ncbi:unnamed protein product [Paramecium sonneborni]|uniref:Uncharacterized protein n=1 Tax=Paramecium sonneborni TaxID=65129 RepID=A0A8S1KPI5_9CILI|nr:unnamed protein product [Paramecium sonneborni]
MKCYYKESLIQFVQKYINLKKLYQNLRRNYYTQIKKQFKNTQKENHKTTQTQNQHQISKIIIKKSKVQQFLQGIHLKILSFNEICEQIQNFYKYKNKITKKRAILVNQTCIYQPIYKQRSTKIDKPQNNTTSINTK